MMDFDDQFDLGHLFLQERKCRTCGDVKDLIGGFYLTRKNRGALASSYSYECRYVYSNSISLDSVENQGYSIVKEFIIFCFLFINVFF